MMLSLPSLIIGLLLSAAPAEAYMSSGDFLAQAAEDDGKITEEDFAVPAEVLPTESSPVVPTSSAKTEEEIAEEKDVTNANAEDDLAVTTIRSDSVVEETKEEGAVEETKEEGAVEETSAQDAPILEDEQGFFAIEGFEDFSATPMPTDIAENPLDEAASSGGAYTEVKLFRNGEEIGVMYIDGEGNIVDPNKPSPDDVIEPVTNVPDTPVIEPEDPEPEVPTELPITPIETPEDLKAAAPTFLQRYGMLLAAGVGSILLGGIVAMLFLKKNGSGGAMTMATQPAQSEVETEKHDRMQAALARMQGKG